MSTKILPTVSDEDFNKAMNFGNTTKNNTKSNSNTKGNLNTKSKNSSVNSVLSNEEDINMTNLSINQLKTLKNESNNMINKNDTDPINNRVKETFKKTGSKLKKTTDNIKDKSSDTLDKLVGRIKETPEQKKNRLKLKEIKKKERKEKREIRKLDGKSIVGPILQIIFILMGVLALSYGVYYYFNNIVNNNNTNGIKLIEGVKDGKQPLVISQDQNNPNYIPIMKSFNLDGGAQFTYSFWFAINDLDYKKGEWKNMWYKGDEYKYNQCPGVFIHENTNKIRINMNVIKQQIQDQEDTIEYIDIDNIPLGMWINLVMVFTEDKKSINPNSRKDRYKNCLDIYINGLLKTRKELSSVPLFNTHDVWVNMNGGFDGVIGNLEYYPRALQTKEIHKILKTCPGESQCGKTLDCPPYLSNSWWFN